MADDDWPLRHHVVLLVSIGLSTMNQEHNARRMSGWCQASSLIIDRWAPQHDSRPGSIIRRRQPFRRAHDTQTPMPASSCETKKRQNGRVPYKTTRRKSPMRLLGRGGGAYWWQRNL